MCVYILFKKYLLWDIIMIVFLKFIKKFFNYNIVLVFKWLVGLFSNKIFGWLNKFWVSKILILLLFDKFFISL